MSSPTLQDTIQKYDIHPNQLVEWEGALGLSIPVNAQGHKLYTRQHLNLFKNIKKHLALGRNLDHIKQIVSLPPDFSAKAVERNVKQAWEHAPHLQNKVKSSPVTVPAIKAPSPSSAMTNPFPKNEPDLIATSLSLASEALLETFKETASVLTQLEDTPDVTLETRIETPVDTSQALPLDEIKPSFMEVEAPAPLVVEENTVNPQALEAESEPTTSIPLSLNKPEATEATTDTFWENTPALLTPEESLASFRHQFKNLAASTSVVDKISTEATPVQHLSAPLASSLAVIQDTQEHSLQIVERLLTEKDGLQQRLVEAEKLNSHLYNVNNLFNRKVKALTNLVQKLKHSYQEEDLMKLMDDKAKLQRQLLDAERDKLKAQREAEALKTQEKKALALQHRLAQELKAQRDGLNPQRFLGNWKESLTLREIQYDTFGLNVETQRGQHRLIDVLPTRIVGNVAFITTRYAYPDNPLWQRLETLSFVFIDDAHSQGELQVDYILDSVPVCRAIYTAHLSRVS
jgi:DNA-binding transcriptional MerR regulator